MANLTNFNENIPYSFEVRRYTAENKSEWDNCVKEACISHFLFYRDYMDYHSDRFVDHSLMIYNDGKLAGVLPANEKSSVIYSHGGLTFGGLLYSKKNKSHEAINMLSSAVAYYKTCGINKFIYKPVPWTYHIVPSEVDLYALNLLGFTLTERHLAATIDYKNILPLSGGRKNQLQKARKNSIELQESSDWEAFIELLAFVLESRHGVVPVHTAAELRLLQSRFPENIKLWIAMKNNKIVAGAALYITDTTVHTQYLASSELGLDTGALDLLIKKLIDDYSTSKRFFCFGVSTEGNGKILNEGLLFQKESFGARSIIHDIWTLNL